MSFISRLKPFWPFQRLYNGFVRLQDYINRHLSPTGKALFLLFLFSLSLGMVGTEVLIYILICSLGSLWASTLLVGSFWRPRRIELSWQVPEQVLAGQPFVFKVRATNAGRPVFACFLELKWQQPDQSQQIYTSPCFYIGRDQSVDFQWLLPAAARGQAEIKQVQLVSLFPLGLVFWRQILPYQTAYWVYPPSTQVPLQKPHAAHVLTDQRAFQSLRPWGAGDSPRYLHWPALARTGQLVIRQYQHTEPPQISLWLDTAPPEHPADFEAAVSLLRRLLEDLRLKAGHWQQLALGSRLISATQGETFALQGLCSVRTQQLHPEERASQLDKLLAYGPGLILIVSTQAETLTEILAAPRFARRCHYQIYAVQNHPIQNRPGIHWLTRTAMAAP